MFDILRDIDDGLFYVYYSGTLLETFSFLSNAQEFVETTKLEMENYYHGA